MQTVYKFGPVLLRAFFKNNLYRPYHKMVVSNNKILAGLLAILKKKSWISRV